MGWWARAPIRRRLVAGFTAVTMVLLVGAGVFVYWRFDVALNRDLDNELIHSGKTLRPLVSNDGHITDRAYAAAPGVSWQVLDSVGRVLDSDSPATSTPLLSDKQFAKISEGDITFNVGALLPRSDEPYRVRLVATRTTPQYHLLVGVRRDQRDKALRDLLGQLLLAGLGILGTSAWIANVFVRSALRPVERYRARAQEIAEGNPSWRLEVPEGVDDEITRLGHTFNDMLASLERALAREREFVSEASHELRTPVTLLTSRVQLALRRPRTPEEYERILTELQTDLGRLARLAEQLLHRETGVGVEAEPYDVRPLVQLVAEQRLPAQRDVLRVDLPEEPVLVRVPPVALERILTNLTDNAFVHGSPPVDLRVDRPEPGWLRIRVSDAGPGMDRRLLTQATRRFARSPEARNRPGTGLGLALVRSMVVESGGQVRLCHGGRHVRHGVRSEGSVRPEVPVSLAAPHEAHRASRSENGPRHGEESRFPSGQNSGESTTRADAAQATSAEDIACEHGAAMTVTVLLPAEPFGGRQSRSEEDET